ncbi:MAG: DUF3604 domain-containing protein [Victivallales bacterium]|nr:DUF3604 domain-containing protein [Victivallales bacterium]
MNSPAAENFISVTGSGNWELGQANDCGRHPWNRGIELILASGCLPAGETLMVALGDGSQGSPGYRSQSFAETSFRFRLGICRDGENDWSVLPADHCPQIRIVGNQAVSLKACVSRPTRNDGKLHVHVKPEDAYGNIAGDRPQEATILLDDHVPIGRVALPPGYCGEVALARPEVSTWQRITVTTDDGRLMGGSNPFGSSPLEGYELFFGEIHCQSGLCDGTNSPDELYRYAREAAGLDFASVSSHDFELTADDWQEIKKATREAHEPGTFVTFLGVEWSGKPGAGGDNNIYFLDDDGPLVYSAHYGGYDAWDPAEGQVAGSRDLSEVIQQLEGRKFMVVPHCGGRRCNLDFYDARVMPLFEIHSCHRTYQDVADESVRRGIRFGFIGGSDDHRGALGDSHPTARERFFSSHNGLVAVYAKELTRESLWEAFFARRTYATNGARMVLTAEVGGHPMGSDVVAVPGATLKMSFWTCLDGLLDRVEIMRDDVLVGTFYGQGNQVSEFSGAMELQAATEPHAYYVRVFQTDGGRAWSSPIWVAPPAK